MAAPFRSIVGVTALRSFREGTLIAQLAPRPVNVTILAPLPVYVMLPLPLSVPPVAVQELHPRSGTLGHLPARQALVAALETMTTRLLVP